MKPSRASLLLLTSLWACAEPSSSQPTDATFGLEDAELVIGSVDGPIETAFTAISDAWLLGDSAVLTVDRMSQDFRVFDRQGRFQYQFGGSGDGPSEFRAVGRVHVRGDTVIAHDLRAAKVVRFLTSGEYLETERAPFFMPDLIAITDSGRFVWGHDYRSRSESNLITEYLQSLSSSRGVHGDPSWIADLGSGWRIDGNPYPTTPIPTYVAFRDSVLVSVPDQGLLRLVAVTEGGERTIPVPIDRIDREEAWDAIAAEAMTRGLVDQAQSLGDMPTRPVPHFGMILPVGDDRLWVKRYDPLEDAHWLGGWAGGEGGTYVVLDAEGRALGEVTLAMRAVPLRVQAGYLLARVRDEFDVQYLALVSLDKLER